MLEDIVEHNKKVLEEPKAVYEDYKIGIFNSEHPILSLFFNWFINKK